MNGQRRAIGLPEFYLSPQDLGAKPRARRIYIAGPMRGLPKFNFPTFDSAADYLRSMGHEVFNPADRDRATYGEGTNDSPTGDLADVPHFDLREALGADLAWITAEADAIALLPGWENSRGAQAELATAKALSLDVYLLKPTTKGRWHLEYSSSSPAKPAESETIDGEARRLVYRGQRQQDYGHPRGDFDRIAKIWSGILGIAIDAEQVAICMTGLKLARLSHTYQHHDSKVDVIGYMLCLDRLADPEDS